MIGYNVTDTGCMDYQSRKAISAFQLHFRPADYSGDPDTETCFIASWIVQRYFPSKMASIDTNLSIGNCQSINFTDFIVRTDYQAIGHEIRPPGVNVSMIHIFSTNANLKDSLNQLSNSLYLSAHYVVPDQPTSDGWEIYQLVNESDIAYHAGLSEWQNRTGVNSISIGVAVVNKAGQPYPNEQMDILAKLLSIIQGKYEITDTCIVGHSDVSPTRSKSPGPFFQWKRLYQNKIGFWPSSSNYNESLAILRKCDVVNCLQRKLNVIGYNITLTGDFDVTTIAVMSAFQMRFRPSNYTGLADLESCAIIDALVKEYFSSNKFCSLDSTATETTTTAGKSVSRNASYFPLIFLGYYTFI